MTSQRAPFNRDLSALAERVGILVHWTDAHGRPQQVSEQTLRQLLAALSVPADTPLQVRDSLAAEQKSKRALVPLIVATAGQMLTLSAGHPQSYSIVCESGHVIEGEPQAAAEGGWFIPVPTEIGYHQLRMGSATTTLAVAPARCPDLREFLGGNDARCWGTAVQVYSLRHSHDDPGFATAGFGDFGALSSLAQHSARHGADVLAISPVHAVLGNTPDPYSPYSPSSRLFLNTLFADAGCVLGAEAVRNAQEQLHLVDASRALDALTLIDWPNATALKMRLLRHLYSSFSAAPPALRAAHAQFRENGGQRLQDHAVFESLHRAQSAAAGAFSPWTNWQAPLRDPRSTRVQAFARQHENEVEFHIFAQWLASASLAHAQHAAKKAGMRVGLVADMAIGASPYGSQAWSHQQDMLFGVSVGAPPDIHNPLGQSWNIQALSPRALQSRGYTAFIEMIRAALANCGGLRIDHILGMARLWLVPEGATPSDGAYLRFPVDNLIRLIALEAWRHRALVVGENLGTVPRDFNTRLEQDGILGMSVLWFALEAPSVQMADKVVAHPIASPASAAFTPPDSWPVLSVAMSTTHDMPTVRGWWHGRDIDWRVQLQLLGPGQSEASMRGQREADKFSLWTALQKQGRVPEGEPPSEAPTAQILSYVASAACQLMLAQMEDLANVLEQPNLPGTITSHPNWRQRLPADIDSLFADKEFLHRIEAISTARRRR